MGGVTWHGTTILCVKKDGIVAMAGDGQVSMGSSVVKGTARKVRRLTSSPGTDSCGDGILVGFAGSTADALTLLERLERKLEEHFLELKESNAQWKNIISDSYYPRLSSVRLKSKALVFTGTI